MQEKRPTQPIYPTHHPDSCCGLKSSVAILANDRVQGPFSLVTLKHGVQIEYEESHGKDHVGVCGVDVTRKLA